MKTPMSSDTKLTKDEECESVDSTKYQGMIGSLLYLTASRPDIMFSVCLCARFQEAPKTSHLEAVKRIFRYIKGTTHLGLWYPKGTGIETVVYADSDHAGDYVDQKSTSGICTFVGCCLTSWFSKKQTALAISTTEAEYVSAGKACQQALWMKQALIDYDVRLDDVPIMCDNKGAIDLSKNPVQHSRTKHIEIRHHFLRDNVQKGHISIEKVPSVDNIADILTKPLKRESFNYLHFVMSDSEHSTVTYTEISSEFEDLSDIESPGGIVHGYHGLPMMPEDPYAYVEAAMQEPPPPDFVLESVYPEFMPPKDDVLLAEEKLLPAAVSPIADSLGYITESDEDPKEGMGRHEEESSGEDAVDEEEVRLEDEDEEST
ncbi:hypothetical protein Tco_0265647 [Tanacetum coccineum]